jgi:hypothetical protein
MCHQSAEVLHIGRIFLLRLRYRLPFGQNHVVFIGQPSASFYKRFPQDVHREVDRASVGIANETFVAIAPYVEGERGVAVGMEGAECLVFLHLQPKPFGHSLDGEGAEFVEFESFHHFTIFT